MVDTPFYSGEILELLAHKSVVSVLQTRQFALANDMNVIALVPETFIYYLILNRVHGIE